MCVVCRTSGIVQDLSLLLWSSMLRSKRNSTSWGSEFRSGLHIHTVLHLTGVCFVLFFCLILDLCHVMPWCCCFFVSSRIWSRWPKSRTKSQTVWPSKQRPRANGSRCWGVWTQTHTDTSKKNKRVQHQSFYFPLESLASCPSEHVVGFCFVAMIM